MSRQQIIGIIAIILLLLVANAYVEAEKHIRWYSRQYQQIPRLEDKRPKPSAIRKFIRFLFTLNLNA